MLFKQKCILKSKLFDQFHQNSGFMYYLVVSSIFYVRKIKKHDL